MEAGKTKLSDQIIKLDLVDATVSYTHLDVYKRQVENTKALERTRVKELGNMVP